MSLAVNKNWASARAYAEAIQAPAVCFRDPQLRQTEPAFDRLGMPLVTSGQFAYVFKLKQSNGAPPFAVRCFRGDAPDREERYRHIAAHLAAHHVPAIGAFKFDPDGILVGGQTFPILLMEWIEGHTLDVRRSEGQSGHWSTGYSPAPRRWPSSDGQAPESRRDPPVPLSLLDYYAGTFLTVNRGSEETAHRRLPAPSFTRRVHRRIPSLKQRFAPADH
jgi:hypothetical protein